MTSRGSGIFQVRMTDCGGWGEREKSRFLVLARNDNFFQKLSKNGNGNGKCKGHFLVEDAGYYVVVVGFGDLGAVEGAGD